MKSNPIREKLLQFLLTKVAEPVIREKLEKSCFSICFINKYGEIDVKLRPCPSD